VPSRGVLFSSKSELALSFPFSSAMNLKRRPLKTCAPLNATVVSGRWCTASSSTTRESQLLQVVAYVAPQGIYICSNTNVGPTIAVVKDVMTENYDFEAE
jgi:DNA replicative helicase MCM subunit Mcm2 (Cdc46/Mcm family)